MRLSNYRSNAIHRYWHGSAGQANYLFHTSLNEIDAFLNDHPQEFVILHIDVEEGPVDASVAFIERDLMYGKCSGRMYMQNRIPQGFEVRGRVIFWRRWRDTNYSISNNAGLYVPIIDNGLTNQAGWITANYPPVYIVAKDLYDPKNDLNLKHLSVMQGLVYAATYGGVNTYLNANTVALTSCSGYITWNDIPFPYSFWTYARGMMLSGIKMLHSQHPEGVNLGIVIGDFMNAYDAERIYQTNGHINKQCYGVWPY